MSERELLELAAKAAGVNGFLVDAGLNMGSNAFPKVWNPLTDDGDALRLAVKLDMSVIVDGENNHVRVYAQSFARSEEGYGACGFGPDKCAATRRAIVRAAAEIGKAMQ